ncbi:MAG: hypothetical protein ACTSU2_03545 [Promethearchaeota archaeon]
MNDKGIYSDVSNKEANRHPLESREYRKEGWINRLPYFKFIKDFRNTIFFLFMASVIICIKALYMENNFYSIFLNIGGYLLDYNNILEILGYFIAGYIAIRILFLINQIVTYAILKYREKNQDKGQNLQDARQDHKFMDNFNQYLKEFDPKRIYEVVGIIIFFTILILFGGSFRVILLFRRIMPEIVALWIWASIFAIFTILELIAQASILLKKYNSKGAMTFAVIYSILINIAIFYGLYVGLGMNWL